MRCGVCLRKISFPIKLKNCIVKRKQPKVYRKNKELTQEGLADLWENRGIKVNGLKVGSVCSELSAGCSDVILQ